MRDGKVTTYRHHKEVFGECRDRFGGIFCGTFFGAGRKRLTGFPGLKIESSAELPWARRSMMRA
jgi:hypothetical protein